MLFPLLIASEPASSTAFSLSDVLAGLAVLISLTGAWITWRIHKESGGRVTVQMYAAAYQPFAGTGRFITNNTGKMLIKETREPSVELCQVVIENPGRVGVTVTSVQLNIERQAGEKYTVTPRTFVLEGFSGDESKAETYFRLDAYDRKTVLFDYWSIIDSSFEKNPALSDIRISAEVTVAGHPNPFTSQKQGYWRIQRGHISAIGSGAVRRPRNAFLLEMLRVHTKRLNLLDHLDHAAVLIEESLTFPATRDEWNSAISVVLDSVEGAVTRQQWADELDRNGRISTGLVAFNLAEQGKQFGPAFKPLHRRSRTATPNPPHSPG